MWHRQFESMGTLWQVTVDGDQVSNQVEQQVYRLTDGFDQQFSRFIKTSEANTFRNAAAGTYTVSAVFAELLQFAQQLKNETHGKFDPAIGSLLEAAGYDADYCFRPDQQKVKNWQTPNWKISNDQLTIDGPIVFDIGGYGKGYWIDQLSKLLLGHGYNYFLVDGGGDMFGTTKQNDQPWKIAIEKPGESDKAIAVVPLSNQGLAISDIFRRQWQDWHHTLDPQQKKPTARLIGCAVLAKNALIADALTTCLSLVGEQQADQLLSSYHATAMIVTHQQKILTSANWPGELL